MTLVSPDEGGWPIYFVTNGGIGRADQEAAKMRDHGVVDIEHDVTDNGLDVVTGLINAEGYDDVQTAVMALMFGSLG